MLNLTRRISPQWPHVKSPLGTKTPTQLGDTAVSSPSLFPPPAHMLSQSHVETMKGLKAGSILCLPPVMEDSLPHCHLYLPDRKSPQPCLHLWTQPRLPSGSHQGHASAPTPSFSPDTPPPGFTSPAQEVLATPTCNFPWAKPRADFLPLVPLGLAVALIALSLLPAPAQAPGHHRPRAPHTGQSRAHPQTSLCLCPWALQPRSFRCHL